MEAYRQVLDYLSRPRTSVTQTSIVNTGVNTVVGIGSSLFNTLNSLNPLASTVSTTSYNPSTFCPAISTGKHTFYCILILFFFKDRVLLITRIYVYMPLYIYAEMPRCFVTTTDAVQNTTKERFPSDNKSEHKNAFFLFFTLTEIDE
jgi:hypothetical protein